MKKIIIVICACLVFPVLVQAQMVRYENMASTTNAPQTPGGYPQLLVIPGATITVCNTNTNPCNSLATTYTDATGNTACSTSAQMTMPGSSTCVATTDNQGNIGWWSAGGTYYFLEKVGSTTYGPYPATVASSLNPNLPATITGYWNFTGGMTLSDHYDKGPMVDPRAYGAKCDGVTNDLVAFQSAIAAAIAGVKALRIPNADCLLTFSSSNTSININGDLTVEGSGKYSSISVGPSNHVSDGCTVTASSPTITCPSIAFTSADVGKTIVVSNAGTSHALLTTTVLSVTNSTTATMATNAINSTSNQYPTSAAITYISFGYKLFNVSPGVNFTVQNLTINGPTYGTPNYSVNAAYMIYHGGGPGVGSVTLLNDNITGEFFEVIAKASGTDDGTTNNTINIVNTSETCYYEGNVIYTLGGTTIPDATTSTVGGVTTLTSASTTFTAADVGSRVALAGAGENGGPLSTTIAYLVDANDVVLADQATTDLVLGTTATGSMQAARTAADGVMNANSATLTSATFGFVASDVGRIVKVTGAGSAGATYSGTIVAYGSATSVTVRIPALTSVTGATVTIPADSLVTTTTNVFSLGSVGRNITVNGAGPGGANFLDSIAKYVSPTQVYLIDAPSTTVSGAVVTVGNAPSNYQIPALNLNVVDSKFINLAYNSGGTYGYYFYIHPSVNILMQGNYFDNAPYYAMHLWSSGGIPPQEVAKSVIINGNFFGPNLASVTGGAIAATDPNPWYHATISNNTIRSHGAGVFVSGGSIEFDNNDIEPAVGFAAILTANSAAFSPARVVIHGGRIGGTGIGVAQPGSTWDIDGVDFENYGSSVSSSYSITNNQSQYTTLIVRNSQFHGQSNVSQSMNLTYGTNIIENNYFAGPVTGAAINIGTSNVMSASVKNNTFAEPSNTVAIQASGLGPQVLTGSGNSFTGAVTISSLGSSVSSVSNKPGIYPLATASAASVTLGNYGQSGLSGWNFDTYHVSGTTTVNNLYIDGSTRQPAFAGSVNLIADAAWSLGSSGNIVPCNTTAFSVGANVRLNYDSLTGKWYQNCLSYSAANLTNGATGTGAVQLLLAGAGNTDRAGQLTLAAGTASYSFTGTYATAPACTSSSSAVNPVLAQTVATTTTLTLTVPGGTNTDTYTYTCQPRT